MDAAESPLTTPRREWPAVSGETNGGPDFNLTVRDDRHSVLVRGR